MKSLLFAASLIFPGSLFAANVVGSGKIASKSYKVTNFNSVEVSGHFKVNMTKGNKHSAIVYGDDNLINHIKTENKGNTLVVKINLDYDSNGPFVLNLESPQITEFYGNGNLSATLSNYDENSLKISLKGEGAVDLQKSNIGMLYLDLIGHSNAFLGEVTTLTGDISKGNNSVNILKKTDTSSLKQGIPSTVTYR